ncbi:MAG: ActS/PrrB/RegB family redox-sensitive histidine kinase [Paracoccaceae bacterium]
MAIPPSTLLDEERRSNWVRLRTLIVLRWIAIVGQLAAILVARQWFNLNLDLGLCFLAVGASVVANLIAIFVYPESKRLSEHEVMWMLIFDITQLSALLYLTGGLNNPFALLILAPVTISATTLRTGATLIVGGIAIALTTLVMRFHIELRTDMGFVMRLPTDFVFGFWVAIVIGVIFLGAYARRVTSEINSMSEALLATQMALAREQKLTDLAGVVAAAAHELGTPLATIKLTSSELIEELSGSPDLLEDAQLIRDQVDRCRDILRSMGRAGKDDAHLHNVPLTEAIREAAEPHMGRGKVIEILSNPETGGNDRQPIIQRRPEIIHGLRNLIQNAVDFAETRVWVDANWSADQILIRIVDDGKGFPPQVIGRIGDPFVRRRRADDMQKERPGYQGMGLGLFIAKTLLERSGAELTFANGSDPFSGRAEAGTRTGAIVEVSWPLHRIAAEAGRGLGENKLITG